MKFKLLSIMMAIAVTLAFTSCLSRKANNNSNNTTNVKREKIEPTGDVEKDIKTIDEKFHSIKNYDDSKELEETIDNFNKYYQEKGGVDNDKWNSRCQQFMQETYDTLRSNISKDIYINITI